MICKNCGNEVPQAKFCKMCGAALKFDDINLQDKQASNEKLQNVSISEKTNQNMYKAAVSDYYINEFDKIANSDETYKGKFNIAAFLFGVIWAMYRGLWFQALIGIIVSVLTGGITMVGIAIWFALRGTWMFYNAKIKNNKYVF